MTVPLRALAAFGVAWVLGCGGRAAPPSVPDVPPATLGERMLAMLPHGAQVVVEIDLARLRGNPVVGEIITRALAEQTGELPAGVPASPLPHTEYLVLAAYGVGTAQAAMITLLASPVALEATTPITGGVYAVGPDDWIEQLQQRVALAAVPGVAGSPSSAVSTLRTEPELLALRRRAMPERAPGAVLRVTARLPFDARVALARQTGIEAAPAQLSAWGDVADDFALIIDCDAADPGAAPAKSARSGEGRARGDDAARRLEATLRGALSAIAEQPEIRALGLPASLAGTKFHARGSWVRMIVAIGPSRLGRVVARAAALLGPSSAPPAPVDAAPSPSPSGALRPAPSALPRREEITRHEARR